MKHRRRLAIAALIVLALLWGYNWVMIKQAVAYAPPFAFAAWRTLGGGLVLLVVALAMRKPVRPQYPAAFLWIGVFQTAGFVGLVTWAVVAAGAGKVAMLAYTMPFWVAILAWPLLGERLRGTQIFAIALALAGIAALADKPSGGFVVEAIAVLAGMSWAAGVVLAKSIQRTREVDLYGLTMWQMLFGGALLTVVAILVPAQATHWTPAYIGILAYNIFLATALAYLLWMFVLRVLPARDASMGTLANPIIGVLAAWLQLGERPSLLEGAGMVLVAVGLAALTFADRNEAA